MNLLDSSHSVITPLNVLILTGDPVGIKLAGPAIRAWNIAEQLSQIHNVRLASFTKMERSSNTFGTLFIKPFDDAHIKELEEWADLLIIQGHVFIVFPRIANSSKILVIDLYDPMHLEQLLQGKSSETSKWQQSVEDEISNLNSQLLAGDYFICASEKQRLFWLGHLASIGRVNSFTFTQDKSLRRLIDVVPFGLSSIAPAHSTSVVKGVMKGIGTEDKLVLWSGGLYDWFDPLTLIRAIAIISKNRPEVKLFFQGVKHPHPGVPEMKIVSDARELASKLGVIQQNVFFNEDWVDFDERQNYLMEADLGISTHPIHIETEFSFRTRILDYLWAGLPFITTKGDFFAELASAEQLGISVPENDPQALALAIEEALFDLEKYSSFQENIKRVRTDFFWENVLIPLVNFVNSATKAADSIEKISIYNRIISNPGKKYRKGMGLIQTGVQVIRRDGLIEFFRKIHKRIKRNK